MLNAGSIHIGTILLDKNRWTPGKEPTYRVSEWFDRFVEIGFDGMELWEYHATKCSPDELALLEKAPLPVSIFNSYAVLDNAGERDRLETAKLTDRFQAVAVKFNVGKDSVLRKQYLANLRAWRSALPEDVTLLCECHPGTIVEEAKSAKRFFDELGMDGFEMIVHPFNRFDSLKEWFDLFGEKVTHAHLQMRDENAAFVRFDRRPALAKQALRLMAEEEFQGSYTLEFTEGTRAPDENIDTLFENAVRDFQFLKELLP